MKSPKQIALCSPRKITGYITKKVAEKLQELFKKDRLDFERKWDDIGTFIKYGLISDEKFAEKAMAFSLFKNVDKVYETIEEYKEKVKDVQTDKNKRLNVLYTHDPLLHHSIIQQCKNRGYDVLLMDQIFSSLSITRTRGEAVWFMGWSFFGDSC